MIDDNSPDGTLQVAKQLEKIYGDNKIVSLLLSLSPEIGVLRLVFCLCLIRQLSQLFPLFPNRGFEI